MTNTLTGPVKVRINTVPAGAAGISILIPYQLQQETILRGYTIPPLVIQTEKVFPSICEGYPDPLVRLIIFPAAEPPIDVQLNVDPGFQ